MAKLNKFDQRMAQRYGPYASYSTELDPISVETYGDGPAEEVDRLLTIYVTPESQVLDLGCGAGFTLCQLAVKSTKIWGFDQNPELLEAARERVAAEKLTNVTLVKGNVAVESDVAHLPDNTFDVVLSRRGPNVNQALLPKLKQNAFIVQELHLDNPGFLEAFGRKSLLASVAQTPNKLVADYSWLGFFPVSIKEYFYESYFKDADHLAAYLSQKTMFGSWPMPPIPYDKARDRAALTLYAQFNTTPKGLRVLHHRNVYLFRRAVVHYAPAAPEVKPFS